MASISKYDPRARYRQRSQQRMSTIASLGVVAVICGGIGYGIGYQSSRLDQMAYKTQIEGITAERDKLQTAVTKLMADSHSAVVKYEQIEEKIQSELPQDGEAKDILIQIKSQLDAGVSPDRLLSVIKTMSPPRSCSEPDVKRVVVKTDKNKAGDNTMLIADGIVTIHAAGESALGKGNVAEAWYDPARPVALTFTWKEGGVEKTLDKKTGLPFSQVLPVAGKEYRMTFAAGAKSFLKVTYDVCDL